MKNLDQLKGFIIEKAYLCIHAPEDKLSFPFITPSFNVIAGADDKAAVPARSLSGHYLQMYDWDACFFSQAAGRIGMNELPTATIENFLSFQNDDGYIPRTISPRRIWDGHDLAKPFLTQTLITTLPEGIATIPNDQKDNFRKYMRKLSNYFTYFEKTRLGKFGLYHWRNVLESGVDNNLALLAPQEAAKDENYSAGSFPDGQLLACDLNTYLVREFLAFAKLIRLVQDDQSGEELAQSYERRAIQLKENIETLLWNEELEMYCNLDAESGEQIIMRSWTGLTPVLFNIAQSERVEQVIEKNILNESHFYRPSGLSSIAASELLYNQAIRGLYGAVIVSNWQGPMWILPNALTVRCLLKHGFQKQAEDLSKRVIKTMTDAVKSRGTLFENYHAETGEPLWAPDFMSWNILALELIELVQ